MAEKFLNVICTFVVNQHRHGVIQYCGSHLSLEQLIAITSWCLATPNEYQIIVHLFSIACATEMVHETCHSVVKVLMKDFIKFPYMQTDLINEVGSPTMFWSSWWMSCTHNYKLQAICTMINTTVWGTTLRIQWLVDTNCLFLNVCVGWIVSVAKWCKDVCTFYSLQ